MEPWKGPSFEWADHRRLAGLADTAMPDTLGGGLDSEEAALRRAALAAVAGGLATGLPAEAAGGGRRRCSRGGGGRLYGSRFCLRSFRDSSRSSSSASCTRGRGCRGRCPPAAPLLTCRQWLTRLDSASMAATKSGEQASGEEWSSARLLLLLLLLGPGASGLMVNGGTRTTCPEQRCESSWDGLRLWKDCAGARGGGWAHPATLAGPGAHVAADLGRAPAHGHRHGHPHCKGCPHLHPPTERHHLTLCYTVSHAYQTFFYFTTYTREEKN